MAIDHGLNPGQVGITSLLTYTQNLGAYRAARESQQEARGGRPWWEQG